MESVNELQSIREQIFRIKEAETDGKKVSVCDKSDSYKFSSSPFLLFYGVIVLEICQGFSLVTIYRHPFPKRTLTFPLSPCTP